MATPLGKNPCHGRGHKIYSFGRPLLCLLTCLLTLFVLCLVEENSFFYEVMNFHYITYMDTPNHKNP